jgi:hypothetical protein
MRRLFAIAFTMFGCTAADDSTTTTESELQCFHTPNSVNCVQISGSDAVDRTKVEDFYPSACLDGDADSDGTPDFLDIDFLGTDAADAPVARDDLRCPRCNRGPGTQNDFRLDLAGDVAELDRGKVYVRAGDQLTVPTPDGALSIAITPSTQLEDGEPAPGAEIRVEGAIVNGVLEATRLKVLCPAPLAMPPEDVPPDAEPTPPGDPILL